MVKQYIEVLNPGEGDSMRMAVDLSDVSGVVSHWQKLGWIVKMGSQTVPYSIAAMSGKDRDAAYSVIPVYTPPVVDVSDDGGVDDGYYDDSGDY